MNNIIEDEDDWRDEIVSGISWKYVSFVAVFVLFISIVTLVSFGLLLARKFIEWVI